MKKSETLSAYLSVIYNATYMPLHYIKGNEIVASFPDWDTPLERMMEYKRNMDGRDETFHYFTTAEDLSIGIVRKPCTDESVIVGPASPVPVSKNVIQSIIVNYALSAHTADSIAEFFGRTPTFNLYQFLNIMSLIHAEMNGELVDILKHFNLDENDIQTKVAEDQSARLMERKEDNAYHDTFYFEQEYLGMIERGDLKALKELFAHVPSFTEGVVANNSLRQAKNIFITNISLATRHAITGGLDIETAYQLSDSYIQEMEKMIDTASVTLLNATAVFDFAKRVADAKIPQGMSPEIFYCLQYISNHINQSISVELLAENMHMERSTLSKKFKRELGFNISSYIMRRKLEEAKSLLRFTDKTISEISEYLCFSSQSYFQNVFKEKYGVTPKSYRSVKNEK